MIEIKSVTGEVLFASGKETIEEVVTEAFQKGADLSRADLSCADLSCADLSCADLSCADLSCADLSCADLNGADLRGANLDFSCLSFSCKPRMAKTDERQRIQLCNHFLAWIANAENATEEEKAIFNSLVDYANRFHREDVAKFERIKP